MNILQPGHRYELVEVSAYEGQRAGKQLLSFVRRRDAAGELLPHDDQTPGLLSQELLRVLIDRVLYLNSEKPCAEDVLILDRLRSALTAFEARAARQTIEKLSMPELADTCPVCHHLLCAHRHPERLTHEGGGRDG